MIERMIPVVHHDSDLGVGGKTMQREGVLDILNKHRHELETFGVKSIALFGSLAREEAQLESDVDILVEFERAIGLLKFLKLQHRLDQLRKTCSFGDAGSFETAVPGSDSQGSDMCRLESVCSESKTFSMPSKK